MEQDVAVYLHSESVVCSVIHTGRIYFHRLPRVSSILNRLMYRFVLIYGNSERI